MFEKKLETLTADALTSLREEAGQTAKKIENSAREFVKIPEQGTFSHVGIK